MNTKTEKVAHTPGPWRVNGNDVTAIVHDAAGATTLQIATVKEAWTEYGVADANARLIAAAPEMAQVLQDELDAIRIWLPENVNADVTDGMFISISKIKIVLEKAGLL